MGNVKINLKGTYGVDYEPCEIFYSKSRNVLFIKCRTASVEIPISCPQITYYGVPKTTDSSIVG